MHDNAGLEDELQAVNLKEVAGEEGEAQLALNFFLARVVNFVQQVQHKGSLLCNRLHITHDLT